ncbi:MAG: hypothetical protein NVSMB64_30220 [Candidatus Velthaea sp.]
MGILTDGSGTQSDLDGKLTRAAQRLRDTSRRIAENAQIQTHGLQQISDVAQEGAVDLARSLAEVRVAAGRAHEAGERVGATTELVDRLALCVERLAASSRAARDTMLEVTDSVARIDEIVTFVREVSERTNLLALNASIEAARAGEHGRGFAVVAGEVGKLAESTRSATKDMEALLKPIRSGGKRTTALTQEVEGDARAGDRASTDARAALVEIATAVRTTEEAFDDVSRSMEAQATRAEELGQSAVQLVQTARSHYTDAAEATLSVNAIDFHIVEMVASNVVPSAVVVATAIAPESHAGRTVTELARRIRTALPGTSVDARPGDSGNGKGELGILSAVRRGEIALASIGCAIVGNVLPTFQLLELPYLLDDRRHVAALLDGSFGVELLGTLRPFGLVGLGFVENGFRHFTNRLRPLREPADLRRLRMRVVESPVHIAVGDALETIAAPLALPKLYAALRDGSLDGQHNPLSNIRAFRLHEVQKHLTLSAHMYTPHVIVASAVWYDSLGDRRAAVDAAIAETIAWDRREAEKADRETLAELRRTMDVLTLDERGRRAFVEATQPAYAAMEQIVGSAEVTRVRQAAASVRRAR